MGKKVLEINFSRYIDLREDSIIRLLSNDYQHELELIHYHEKTRGLLYKNIDENLGKRLHKLRMFVKDVDIIKLDKEIAEVYDDVILEGWHSEYGNHRIKMYVNDFPCRVYWKKISSDIDFINKKLSWNVAKMIKKVTMTTSLRWEKVFVWIKFYMPLKHYDIDNNYYKPIIDGIVRSGLIDNDDFQRYHLALMDAVIWKIRIWKYTFMNMIRLISVRYKIYKLNSLLYTFFKI
jgi:hypothetical protein